MLNCKISEIARVVILIRPIWTTWYEVTLICLVSFLMMMFFYDLMN